MNNKGFTMVELLVAMAILALLTVMAFPTLRIIQNSNSNKKFEAYSDGVVSAAKLYTDNYSEDMFDGENINYYTIDFKDLYKNGLLKDINLSDNTCTDSRVVVAKNGDNYTYCLDIKCNSKGSNSVTYESSFDSNECKKFTTYKVSYFNGLDNKKYFSDKVINGMNYKLRTYADLSHLSDYKREHYNLNGWKSSDGTVYSLGQDLNNIEKNYKLYATWVGKDYTVTFDSNGGSSCPSITKRYSETASWGDLCIPTKYGYSFVKWVDSKGNDFTSSSPIKGNVSVSAVWSIKDQNPPAVYMYKWKNINTNPNGNTSGLASYNNDTWIYDKVLTKPGSVAGAVKYQYTTTGTTRNESAVDATYRSVEAEGISSIKWRACDNYGCTRWSDVKTIKEDRTPPVIYMEVGNDKTSQFSHLGDFYGLRIYHRPCAYDPYSGVHSYTYDEGVLGRACNFGRFCSNVSVDDVSGRYSHGKKVTYSISFPYVNYGAAPCGNEPNWQFSFTLEVCDSVGNCNKATKSGYYISSFKSYEFINSRETGNTTTTARCR